MGIRSLIVLVTAVIGTQLQAVAEILVRHLVLSLTVNSLWRKKKEYAHKKMGIFSRAHVWFEKMEGEES